MTKNRTVIGKHAKTSSNNTFVAPVTVGDGASTGAGTVVRRDVPPGALAVSGGPQRNLKGWTASKRPGTKMAEAAEAALAAQDETPYGGLGSDFSRQNQDNRATRTRGVASVSGMKRTTEKNLMVFSGGPTPNWRRRWRRSSAPSWCRSRPTSSPTPDLHPLRGVGARVRRLRDPEPHRPDQRVDHGAPDHGRRAEARLGQADHRRAALLRLRAPGQEAPRARAHLGAADGRPLQDRGGRPADRGRPARRPDPGFLRRPGRPPDGAADPRRRRQEEVRRPADGRGTPEAGRIKVAERWSARLEGAPLAFIHKSLREDRPNETVANRVVGKVDGQICVLVDDMIDTGGTIVKAAEA